MFKSHTRFIILLFVFLFSIDYVNALSCGSGFGSHFLERIGITAPQTSSPLCVNLSANVNSLPTGYTFKIIINTSTELKTFGVSNISIDGGSVKEIRKLSKTSYFAIINPADDAKVVNVQIESGALEDVNGNKNDEASNEVIVKIIKPVVVTNNSSSTSNNTSFISSLIDKISSSLPTAPTCTYTAQGQLITGSNLNTSNCPQTNSSTNSQTQMYSCYGQQIPNTQQCPYDPYREAQQQQLLYQQQLQRQQLAQQQAQQNQNGGLSGILSSLLSGKGFGGGNNVGQSNPFQQQRIEQAPPAPPANPPPAVKSDAEKLKEKLDACKDEACKTAAQKEIDDAKAKADADAAEKAKKDAETPKADDKKDTPAQNKNYPVVIRKLDNCGPGRPNYCSKVTNNQQAIDNKYFPSFDRTKEIAYLLKKGDRLFAIVGSLNKINMRKDECIVEDPELSKNLYDNKNILNFNGCSKEIGEKFMGQGHLYCSEDPSTAGINSKELGIRIYSYTGPQILKSVPCNK